MTLTTPTRRAILGAALVLTAMVAWAAGPPVGITISVDGNGFFLNPVIDKVMVTQVLTGSLAANAGIVAGDEIVMVEGQTVKGKRALDLKPLMKFEPGETRTLRVTHANGDSFEARLTKPKE